MIAPLPVVFEPIFKPKPWGGRRFETRLGKRLPAGASIGESWELVSLAGDESRVRGGPLAGTSVAELVERWGSDLLGGAALVDGRFPLLLKYLDAAENLSVQVHPQPGAGGGPVKHESWYVIDAEPGACVYIGLQPGVTPEDLHRAADSPAVVELLRRRAARPGDCFYLPSGVLHALGAGTLVAEVTYRLYDWDRRDAQGRPRELHIAQALAHTRFDVDEAEIVTRRRHVASVFSTATRLTVCDSFLVEKVRVIGGTSDELLHSDMAIWMVLRGSGVLRSAAGECPFSTGDTLLLPARMPAARVEALDDCEWLDVKIPVASSLGAFPHPQRETPPAPRGAPVPLARPRPPGAPE